VNRFLAPTLALAAASAIIVFAMVGRTAVTAPSLAVLLAVAVPTLLAPLFWPREEYEASRLLNSIAPALVAAAFVAALWRLVQGARLPVAHLATAALVAVLLLTVAHLAATLVELALVRVGMNRSSAREWSYWTITAMLWILAATPLWLGPVADLAARTEPDVPTLILGASPLAHLASAAGCDLLRSPWFYGHSSLGALQVEYPPLATLLIAYAIAGAVLALLLIPFGHAPKDTSAVEPRLAQGERRS
jgi:hypothetical protein